MVTAATRFDGRVAVVTGAGSGIGAAVARRLAADGAVVAALDLDLDAARALAAELPGTVAIAVDVADPGSVDGAVAEVESEVGPIDLVAHIAGVDAHRDIKRRLADRRAALAAGSDETGFRGVVEMSDDEWHRVVDINLDGTFYVVRAVLRPMIARRRGAIVTTASSAAMSGILGAAHYSASKGGVRLFTQSVAREVAAFGIRVNTVAPGMTATPMFGRNPNNELLPKAAPIERVADAAEVAAAFVYLLSDEASYVVGETLNVNGGLVIQ